MADVKAETPAQVILRADGDASSADDAKVDIPQESTKLRPEREARASDYFRVFSYAKKFDYFLMVVAAIACIGAGITMPIMNVVFGRLAADFSNFGSPQNSFSPDSFNEILNRQTLYIFILFLARFIANYLNKLCFRMIGIRMSSGIRMDYLRSLFGQTVHVLDSMPSGSAAGTITSTANTLQLGISEKLGIFLEFFTMFVSATIISFVYSWKLTLVVCSIIFFILLSVSILLPFIMKGTSKVTRAEAKATSVASEGFNSIRMVQACNAEQRLMSRFGKWAEEARKYGQATSPLISLQFALVFLSIYAAFALAFWYGTRLYTYGEIADVGTIIIVLMSMMLMVMSIERMSTPLLAASKATVAAAEFFAVIDAPKPYKGSLKEPEVTATQDIVFSGVDFAYPGRPHVKVLDGLDLRIEAGKVTAIVGPSGSGKSTIVGLVEKWYSLKNDQYVIAKAIEKDKKKEAKEKKKKKEEEDRAKGIEKKEPKGLMALFAKKDTESDDEDDTEVAAAPEEHGPAIPLKGSIQTCGQELDEIEPQWWRSQIGLVQQEPFLFNDSIYNNVAYGLIGSKMQDLPMDQKKKLVEEACKEAFADEFIERLPDGYETLVGDSGTKLSGGQRQRISIARAIIKQPKILILDEATSAIDVRSEKIVAAALDRASKADGRTTITIAHRLSTIKKADRICVMKKGRCVEEGTHESLLTNEEGVYYGLVHAQQLALGDDKEGHDALEESIGEILGREKSAAHSEAENAAAVDGWKKRGLFNGFGFLLYEQRAKAWIYAIIVLAACAAAAATPLMAWLFAQVINVFTFTGQRMLDESLYWTYGWVILAGIVGVGYFVLGLSSTTIGHSITARYRTEYFESLMYQKTSFFDEEGNASGSLTGRVSGDPKQLEELLGMNMAMVLVSVLNLIGALIISFIFGWKLALVAFFVTVPIGLVAGYYRFQYELEFEKMYAEVFSESSKWAAEAIGAFRTVQSLTLEPVICDRYDALLQNHVSHAFKNARWKSLVFAFSDSVALACQALIFWYGGRLLSTGEYQLLNFFVCFMAVMQGAEGAGQGLSFGPNAAQSSAAANRILQTRASKNKDIASRDDTIPDTEGGVSIRFDDVHFKYMTRNVSIFRGLDITIEKGQFAALVGASGSGKTSIVSLLERFYEPQKGRILLNDTDINTINIYEYRHLLSLVAQEATLLQGTIRENILLGVDPATITEERLKAVCADAGLTELLAGLPDGLNTDVGSKGVSLSGGQKQRVAIARALIRDPKLLLLDEATSSLDSETEKQIQATFDRVAKGRTTVAVAHRLSTIQNADIIFVLGEGKVLERGNHAELLKKRGVYYHMCHSQALDR